MSKNVAVFVDVANIFYAAKAAGVDIDYVTLLKSATAGRDFVRAYAYTGLDPENENQRQFHSFLTRSGYKVISKDIRKYGDGRIKANLDIELVVDMMRMAQHIDIAVVVSGDGDFAPAIRAVQQLGVRCEVISFRGNTSSDLIDVADVFTDITQIARVEKGARSGRRVAAEGDLSMTAVPEKETEGLTRRRRGRRPEREEREEHEPQEVRAVAEAIPSNLIVLPGERLSRVGAVGEPEEVEVEVEVEEEGATQGDLVAGVLDADGEARRRRRRRGGRGRGRGRQQEGEGQPVEIRPEQVTEDEEFLEDEIAPQPQHSTFGSVWDSQLGVTPSAVPAGAGPGPGTGDEDEYEDEPEIPEYLLAERRQRGRGARGVRPVNRRAGYQSAVDRERYGRSGASSFGGGSGNRIERSRPPQGNRGPRPPQQSRPVRPSYQEPMREQERPMTASAEPWSEVPPEVQELLRAELARRQSLPATAPRSLERPRPETPRAQTAGTSDALAPDLSEPTPDRAAPTRGRTRSRVTRTADGATAAPAAEVAASAGAASTEEAVPAPTGRRTRRTATTPTASDAGSAAPSEAVAASGEAAAPSAPRTRSRRTTAATTSSASAGTEAAAPSAAPAEEAQAAPTRRRTTRTRTAAVEPDIAASEAPAAAEAPPTRRRTTRSRTVAETEG